MTDVVFSIDSTPFDENYRPLSGTRITTNFANLARGENRQENLCKTFALIDDRLNELAAAAMGHQNQYTIKLEIVSVSATFDDTGTRDPIPLIEILETTIVDSLSGAGAQGIVGNNFSSYVRDYDFSVVLPTLGDSSSETGLPETFGELHGNLFKAFLASDAYAERFSKPPVICLSVSSTKTYHRTNVHHPVLGAEYRQSEYSLTDAYFAKMGLDVRFFMPPGGVAPLAFYHLGDLQNQYTDLELATTISTMETFQKIYRPEIYNAHQVAGISYRPSLTNPDFSTIPIVYDREERSRLALEQGSFAEEHFMKPHGAALDVWSKRFTSHQNQPQKARR